MSEVHTYDFKFSSRFYKHLIRPSLKGEVDLRMNVIISLVLEKILPGPGFTSNMFGFALRDLFRTRSGLYDVYRQSISRFLDRDFNDRLGMFVRKFADDDPVSIVELIGVPRFSEEFEKEITFGNDTDLEVRELLDQAALEFLNWIKKNVDDDGVLTIHWAIFTILKDKVTIVRNPNHKIIYLPGLEPFLKGHIL